MKYNVNDMVTVTLTERGEEILLSRYAGMKCNLPWIPGYHVDSKLYKSELWDIMNIFGSSMSNGCDIPFVNNIVDIKNTK